MRFFWVSAVLFLSMQTVEAFRLNKPSISPQCDCFSVRSLTALAVKARPLPRALMVVRPLAVGLIVYQAWQKGLFAAKPANKNPQNV